MKPTDDETDTPSRDVIFTAVAQSITVFGFLSIAGLLISGLVFMNMLVAICALIAAAASYITMFSTMIALSNPASTTAYQLSVLVNPTMTLIAAAFWLLGMFQLWG